MVLISFLFIALALFCFRKNQLAQPLLSADLHGAIILGYSLCFYFLQKRYANLLPLRYTVFFKNLKPYFNRCLLDLSLVYMHGAHQVTQIQRVCLCVSVITPRRNCKNLLEEEENNCELLKPIPANKIF